MLCLGVFANYAIFQTFQIYLIFKRKIRFPSAAAHVVSATKILRYAKELLIKDLHVSLAQDLRLNSKWEAVK